MVCPAPTSLTLISNPPLYLLVSSHTDFLDAQASPAPASGPLHLLPRLFLQDICLAHTLTYFRVPLKCPSLSDALPRHSL